MVILVAKRNCPEPVEGPGAEASGPRRDEKKIRQIYPILTKGPISPIILLHQKTSSAALRLLPQALSNAEGRETLFLLTRTPIFTAGRDSQLIDIHLHARTKSNFAEVGFGARIARPKNTRYPRNSSPSIGIPVNPTSDFGLNSKFTILHPRFDNKFWQSV